VNRFDQTPAQRRTHLSPYSVMQIGICRPTNAAKQDENDLKHPARLVRPAEGGQTALEPGA
jgi:hypothetical protein